MKLPLLKMVIFFCALCTIAYASDNETTITGTLLTTAGNSGQSILLNSRGEQFFIDGASIAEQKIRKACEYDSACKVKGTVDQNNFIVDVSMAESVPQKAPFLQAVKEYNNKNYSDAIQAFKAEAKSGNPDALYYLGIMARDGLGVRKDKNNAIKLLKASIEHGGKDAAIALNGINGNEPQQSPPSYSGGQASASESNFSLDHILQNAKQSPAFWIVLIGGAIVLKIMFWYFVITFIWGKLKFLFGRA